MINWGLRASQINAKRNDPRTMNIIERTRLWYRLERIGKEGVNMPQITILDLLAEEHGRQPTNREMLDKLHRLEVIHNDLMNRLNSHVDASRNKDRL